MAPLQGKSLLSRLLEEKEKITKWLSVGVVQIEGTTFHKDVEAGENRVYEQKQGKESKVRLFQQSLAVMWRMD